MESEQKAVEPERGLGEQADQSDAHANEKGGVEGPSEGGRPAAVQRREADEQEYDGIREGGSQVDEREREPLALHGETDGSYQRPQNRGVVVDNGVLNPARCGPRLHPVVHRQQCEYREQEDGQIGGLQRVNPEL
jgi:hypothetical protein